MSTDNNAGAGWLEPAAGAASPLEGVLGWSPELLALFKSYYGSFWDSNLFPADRLEVIDWSRFQNRRQVASYTGLCPGEHSTGQTRRELSIDKHGNRRVRRALIEAAWRLLLWQPDYPPLQKVRAAQSSRGRKRAIVAVARRLAIDLWRLATGQTTREKVGLAATATVIPTAHAA